MKRDELAALLDRGWTLERIGRYYGRHPATVSYWLAKHGLAAVNAAKHAAMGPLAKPDLERMTELGMSIAEIGRELGRSKGAVRHWLAKYGLRTQGTRRWTDSPTVIAAREAGLRELEQECPRHGRAVFVREGRGYYRCRQCRVESVTRHRRRLKELLIAEAGGSCVICGYDRNQRALQFHHLDRSQKQFALSQRGVTLSLERLRDEARKCILLCANCHVEVEAGTLTVPLEFRPEYEPPMQNRTDH